MQRAYAVHLIHYLQLCTADLIYANLPTQRISSILNSSMVHILFDPFSTQPIQPILSMSMQHVQFILCNSSTRRILFFLCSSYTADFIFSQQACLV